MLVFLLSLNEPYLLPPISKPVSAINLPITAFFGEYFFLILIRLLPFLRKEDTSNSGSDYEMQPRNQVLVLKRIAPLLDRQRLSFNELLPIPVRLTERMLYSLQGEEAACSGGVFYI
jgi:hypothetical protein